VTVQLQVFTPAGYRVAEGAGGPGSAFGPGSGSSPGPAATSGPGSGPGPAATSGPGSGPGPAATSGPGSGPGPAAKRLPVEVVDLTGYTASGRLPNYQQIASTYRVLVAVVTAPAVVPGVNVPEGTQGELFWSQDLRTALIAHYGVDTSPSDWGVAGVGQSGGAAINLAVQDSTHYGLAAAVGDWTSAPLQDSWPGIDKYLATVPTPAIRLLYDPTAPGIPAKLRLTAGALQVATQSGLTLTSALDWLGASIQANAGVAQ
jgi:hypothetical protein